MLMSPRDCKEHLEALGTLAVVPAYENAGTIGTVLADMIKYCNDILVVDDGSTDSTGAILATFGFRLIREDSVSSGNVPDLKGKNFLRHSRNSGKGKSLKDALILASRAGYRYVLTIDADGQHFPSDIPAFAEAVLTGQEGIIVGARNLKSENMPSRNTFANRFSNFWYRLETGTRLADTQCGFRMYPLGWTDFSRWYYTSLYEFELEVIVFAAWSRISVTNVPVRIYYPPEEKRVSHFRPLRDFTRISILNTVLVLLCIFWIWPRNILRKLSWTKIRRFFDDNLFHVKDSNTKLTLSFWLGVFIGLLPFGGYHFVTAVFLAHIFRLNTLVAGAFTLISIVPVMPVIIFCSCWTGCLILGHEMPFSGFDITFADAGNIIVEYVLGGVAFAAVASSLAAGVCALILKFARIKK